MANIAHLCAFVKIITNTRREFGEIEGIVGRGVRSASRARSARSGSHAERGNQSFLLFYLSRCFNGRDDARAGDNNGGGGAFGGEDDFVVAVEGAGIGLGDLML